MRIVFVMCALAAAACGGSDSRPAQDPASVAETTSTSAPTSNVDVNADPTPPAAAPTQDTATVATTNRVPASRANSSSITISPGVTSPVVGSANSSMLGTNSGGPLVVDNPGAHDQTKNADNTKINDRDRHGALTPMNQGNSADETKITASIRKGLMGDSSLSFTAKNVKVITVGTKVTLRGPVSSDQEKSTIETRAKQTAGVTEVDNQLEVKK
jgi:hyperosmotically inducible protein